MIRLGHIVYSNCHPVHALLLESPPDWIRLVRGVPAELNAALAAGRVDVAPASSVEYLRRPHELRIIPGFTIAADGPVRSIVVESQRPLDELDAGDVALPTASATSVILLRLLLETRLGVRPRYRWFDQAAGDPLHEGDDAVLWIGDAALARSRRAPYRYDLAESWHAWTGLPFVFALWQTRLGPPADEHLADLHVLLTESLAYFHDQDTALAGRYAAAYRMTPAALLAYWRALKYTLDDRALQALRHFYALAAQLGEAAAPPPLRFTPGRQA
ncbi:MAG: menaquinone biosynthetic enzyme MqnA/MqnD family protein [Longimicrobiales bacterium]